MANSQDPTTAICGFDADSILIRGKNLVEDVIGRYTLTGAFLLQALGKEPSERQIELLDVVLVTIMEHGMVPSVVASRLTLHGAPESLQGAVAAGLLGVGDRYAGTAAQCGEVLAELIDSNDRDSAAADLVRRYRAEKRAVPGFGHPIHTGTDPRVEKLLSYVARDSQALQAAESLEGALSEALGKPLVMNVSTALAILMFEIGIPVSAMRGVILISRCAGLVGHLLEEMNTPVGNDLWRSAEGSVTYQPN
ncbi:MAG: citryl-CoA lyase [Halieaceae bacterium]|jgi:citrate synthase